MHIVLDNVGIVFGSIWYVHVSIIVGLIQSDNVTSTCIYKPCLCLEALAVYNIQ